MATITLQFSTSTEWSSAVIRRLLHSPFSHVDYVVPGEGLFGASDPGGVMLRGFQYQPFLTRHNATLQTTPKVVARFHELMLSETGRAFDNDALWSFLSTDDRPWRQRDRWVCSELLCYALEAADFFPYPLAVQKNRVSPADLLLLLNPYFDVDAFLSPLPLNWAGDPP